MFLKPKLEVISGDDFEMTHQATLSFDFKYPGSIYAKPSLQGTPNFTRL